MEARHLLGELEQESRSARRILYPSPGSGDQTGLWILDSEAKTVRDTLEVERGSADDIPGASLHRHDGAAGEHT